MRIYLSAALALFSACSAGGPEKVTRDHCQQVREHAAKLRMGNVAADSFESEKHLSNFANAGGEAYLDECVAERNPEWVNCSLAATTLAEMQKCGG